jgi:hypothetical protein
VILTDTYVLNLDRVEVLVPGHLTLPKVTGHNILVYIVYINCATVLTKRLNFFFF